MTRLHIAFACEGAQLVGTLDEGPGATGLLVVSGGNEIRSGAWGNQSILAREIAARGHPVFRFDRRGVGDSEGENGGFGSSGPDMKAALAAFRREAPSLRKVVAFGNCDGASALALHCGELDLDGLVLANPWTIDGDDTPDRIPASAIRSRYLQKIANPKEWLRFLSGSVNLRKLTSGLLAASSRNPVRSGLGQEMHTRLARYGGSIAILLAQGDRTAQLFEEAWPKGDPRIARCASRSHSFSDEPARRWLVEQVLATLES